MGKQLNEKPEELNTQTDEYQILFEQSPCYITVHDKDLRLIRYNREFADKFSPELGDYCYKVYKDRSERCEVCPVLRTFEDGKSHSSEEVGVSKDGATSYWLTKTAPIKNTEGEVVAAMEMSLDLTHVKLLEEKVKKSEEQYRIIFNTIPNPLFVLDGNTFDILDCNDSATAVYGFNKSEFLGNSFLDLFEDEEREKYASEINSSHILHQVKHIRKNGSAIYVIVRISSSEYLGRNVLLVTTGDITKRIIAEQQLIQASKMGTLGEMATGVAHELNQPLSVIKTASTFLVGKVKKGEIIQDEIMKTLAEEIDSHVDRASNIINHMREFGRRSDINREKVKVNEPLNKAFEFFSQQLKLRGIEVIKELEEDLPPVLANPNRLEQVFVNLLINARDAIEKRHAQADHAKKFNGKIFLKTSHRDGMVIIEVKDTGTGIPGPVLAKIFEPFFTTKTVGKGTGLGLSISYSIVQDYNGTIEARTQEGEGSNFIIRIPVADKD